MGLKKPYKFYNVKDILFQNVTLNGEKVVLPQQLY